MSLALYLSRVRPSEVLDRIPLSRKHLFWDRITPGAPTHGLKLSKPFGAPGSRERDTTKRTVRNGEHFCGGLTDESVLIKSGRPIDAFVCRAQERTFGHGRLQVHLSSHLLAAMHAGVVLFVLQDECERHIRSNG